MTTENPLSPPPRLVERVSRLPMVGKAFNVLSSAYDRYGKNSEIPIVRTSVLAVEDRLHGKCKSNFQDEWKECVCMSLGCKEAQKE